MKVIDAVHIQRWNYILSTHVLKSSGSAPLCRGDNPGWSPSDLNHLEIQIFLSNAYFEITAFLR
jgi:hypothetical protein